MECAEEGCAREASVELHIPWEENKLVCTAHARVLARDDGIVPDPLDGHDDAWP